MTVRHNPYPSDRPCAKCGTVYTVAVLTKPSARDLCASCLDEFLADMFNPTQKGGDA